MAPSSVCAVTYFLVTRRRNRDERLRADRPVKLVRIGVGEYPTNYGVSVDTRSSKQAQAFFFMIV